ncbi:MAG: CfrBI family restriction endonuclease [Synergistaceae bacterium]|nr:CfrBI family restriction endonuclease [Synergistaceae bacterium]
MTFEEGAVNRTISRLLSGEDYRLEVVSAINAQFFDFSIGFFREILEAKLNGNSINMLWYSQHFINAENITPDDAAVYSGLNKKTITNIYGHATRKIVLDAANSNFEYLRSMLQELENDADNNLAVTLSISRNDISVSLSLTESLIVINALATKKLQIRGGAWSSIGKEVEKPLVDELCRRAGVPAENIDNRNFSRDRNLDYDREVDYKLISRTGKTYRVEVKLMGKGNPESADATIARDSDIFIADTLSLQNCSQLRARGIEYLMLRENTHILDDFRGILDRLNIPYRTVI